MCDDSGPCAENELNDLISRSDAHPCAVTPTCATLNKSHTLPYCDVNAHPCAVTPTCAIPSKSNTLPCCDVNAHPCAADMYERYGGNHTPHCCTGGAPFERPPCAIPNSTMCYTEHTPRVETDRHCCLCACLPAVRPYRTQSTHSTKTQKTQPTKKRRKRANFKSGELLVIKKSPPNKK